MEEKFKKAVIYMSLPAFLNIAIAIYCYENYDLQKFAGYLAGTILCVIFSALWLWMAKKVTVSNPFKLFTISIGLFPVKLLVFMATAFGTHFLLNIDKFYFGFSFLLGTLLTLLVEVKFIVEMNREFQRSREKR